MNDHIRFLIQCIGGGFAFTAIMGVVGNGLLSVNFTLGIIAFLLLFISKKVTK